MHVCILVYTTEDFEEPAFQYVPDVPLLHMLPNSGSSGEIQSPLSASMLLLAEAIESDSISSQFELIFRRKPGLSCEVAKLAENVPKNRYRDISPCKLGQLWANIYNLASKVENSELFTLNF